MMFFSQTYSFPFLYIITQYANTKLSGHTHFCAIAQKAQRNLVVAWGGGEFLFYFDVLLKHLRTMNFSWGTSTASDEERRACMLGDLTRFDTRTMDMTLFIWTNRLHCSEIEPGTPESYSNILPLNQIYINIAIIQKLRRWIGRMFACALSRFDSSF